MRMGKQFSLWFLAALAGGVAALFLGSWFHLGGLPPVLSRVLHGPSPGLDSPAGQAALRANAPSAPDGVQVLKPGDRVPADFRLPDLDGRPQSLAAYRGKRVLLNFWATWCHPCREEMPELAAAQKKHAGKVQVIGIAMDTPANVRKWLAHTPVDYPIWQGLAGNGDPTLRFNDTLGALPYSVLIGTDGRIVATHLGKLDATLLRQWLQP